MDSKLTLFEFFTELTSYLDMTKELTTGNAGKLNGIGVRALTEFPELQSGFHGIRGVMYLEWPGSIDARYYSRYNNAVPYSYSDSKSRLYLPVNQVSAGYTPVNGETRTFRRGSSGDQVNLVIYKDAPPISFNMAMILRNTVMCPWLGTFTYILKTREMERVTLVIPKYQRDVSGSARDYRVQGRIVRFSMSDIVAGMQPCVLTFLPDLQDMDLLDSVGV